MASYDQKSHVAAHFTCLNLKNGMVPLMLLAAYDIASTSGIKLPKCHVAHHFNWFDLGNAMLPLTTLSASLDARAGATGVIK